MFYSLQHTSDSGHRNDRKSDIASKKASVSVSKPKNIQAKLTIGKPDDQYEQEADRMADTIMSMPKPYADGSNVQQSTDNQAMASYVRETFPDLQTGITKGNNSLVQQQELEKEEEMLQATPFLDNQVSFIQTQVEPEEEEELLQPKFISENINDTLVQGQFEEIEKRKKAVKAACKVCTQEWEIPDIIKQLAPNIIAIHPQRVEQFTPLSSEMNLMIAYPKINVRPAMSDVPVKGKEEFEYLDVKVSLPYQINRPGAPIVYLGRSEGSYIVKSRNAWLRAHCGIDAPVIFSISSAEHKKNLRPLATQYEEVFNQFKSLGQYAQSQQEAEEKEESNELIQPKLFDGPIHSLIQKQEGEEEELQFQREDSSSVNPNARVESTISSLKGMGQPLSESVRSYLEPRFGYDFSQVRVHTGRKAVETSEALNAKAFTTGTDIFFNKSNYSPETSEGKRLLAHELTHVLQQEKVTPDAQRSIIQAGSPFKQQDKRTVEKIAGSQDVTLEPFTAPPTIQRFDDEEEMMSIPPESAEEPPMSISPEPWEEEGMSIPPESAEEPPMSIPPEQFEEPLMSVPPEPWEEERMSIPPESVEEPPMSIPPKYAEEANSTEQRMVTPSFKLPLPESPVTTGPIPYGPVMMTTSLKLSGDITVTRQSPVSAIVARANMGTFSQEISQNFATELNNMGYEITSGGLAITFCNRTFPMEMKISGNTIEFKSAQNIRKVIGDWEYSGSLGLVLTFSFNGNWLVIRALLLAATFTILAAKIASWLAGAFSALANGLGAAASRMIPIIIIIPPGMLEERPFGPGPYDSHTA